MTNSKNLCERAQALNSFRKKELKQQYKGFKYLYKAASSALFDYSLSILALAFSRKKSTKEKNDFLLLQSSEKVIRLNRKHQLKKELGDRSHTLAETYLCKPGEILTKKRYARPSLKVPLRYYLYAAHAEWLINEYNPKIILNDRNGSIFALFLKERIHLNDGLLVHLAHATTLESSRRLSMIEYDYYFLFGQSSYEALIKRKSLFGSAKCVLAGSHMIDQSFAIEAPNITQKTILLLGSGPDREKLSGYTDGYQLFLHWAEERPDYNFLIKLHPRSKVEFWKSLPKNLEVLDTKVSLAAALERSSIAVTIETNSVLEAGLCSRPIINIASPSLYDLFDLEPFFGAPARTVAELDNKLEHIERNFAASVETSTKFSQRHLANGLNGLDTTLSKLLELLTEGKTDFDAQINGT